VFLRGFWYDFPYRSHFAPVAIHRRLVLEVTESVGATDSGSVAANLDNDLMLRLASMSSWGRCQSREKSLCHD
jgi:hypothetical protein